MDIDLLSSPPRWAKTKEAEKINTSLIVKILTLRFGLLRSDLKHQQRYTKFLASTNSKL